MLRQVMNDHRMILCHAVSHKDVKFWDCCGMVLFSGMILLTAATQHGILQMKYHQMLWCFNIC